MHKIIAFLGMSFAALPSWADRINAEAHCAKGDTGQLYECVLLITKNLQPLEGAEFVVLAEMPSMPMAHNMRPVTAHPTHEAGTYHAVLDIAMDGAWVLKLVFEKPQRDLVVVPTHFPPDASRSENQITKHKH